MNLQPLRSFRLVCSEELIPLVEDLLSSQGFQFSNSSFSFWSRDLIHEPFPLGSSLAAVFGYIYIQDRSSMLPPLALNPANGTSVLDMCASPGSKTSFLGQLVGKNGFVLANEPTTSRLGTLRRNLSTLNLLQCSTMCFPGEAIPLGEETCICLERATGWDNILLDPPCSGWGTVEKNPLVLELWKGEKVKPLVNLQRQLLSKAYNMLNVGGQVVYSTCTTNSEENEDQLAFACDELGFEFVSLPAFSGFTFRSDIPARFSGALAVPTSQAAQGFFVALLRKPAQHTPQAPVHDALNTCTKNTKASSLTKNSYKSGKTVPAVEYLSPTSISSELVRAELLPPGRLGVFNGIIHFLPKASETLLPEKFNWKGFPVGKLQGGKIKINNGLRVLMPTMQNTSQLINVEDPAPIVSLISGQSMGCECQGNELGLYFKGLPLCRLTVKGRRAMLPPLV